MQINDFTEKFVACLNTAPAVPVDGTTNFKKLDEWSSIFALIVIAMVDSEYGKTLTSDDIRNAETIHDLYIIIQSK
ncbi:MAG: acyl carrier protein [Bacteroidetes bacterium]|nr:acyl carrier protein [Bacteroidota bacterium]MBS1685313.1 acyl carrier protein [Bacteroidota bacterium]